MSLKRLLITVVGSAGAFAAGAGAAAITAPAPANAFPPPIVSMSTQASSADSLRAVVQWVKRCAGTVCPSRFHFVVEIKLPDVAGPDAAGTLLDTVVTGTRSQLAYSRWLCEAGGTVNDTLRVTVSAVGVSGVDSSATRTAKLRMRCRGANLAERTEIAAMRDTFPQANTRMVWAPSAVAGSNLAVGGQKALCFLAKNRYTNRVTVRGGDPIVCESVRLSFEREGSG